MTLPFQGSALALSSTGLTSTQLRLAFLHQRSGLSWALRPQVADSCQTADRRFCTSAISFIG